MASQADIRAAQRYGRRVDSIAQQYRNPITGKPLSGAALLLKLRQGEGGSAGMNAVSSAGARGKTQFMPGTRDAILKATGGRVDPWRSTDEAFEAAAIHLTGKLGHRKGLEGYNPGGGQSYVNYILGQKVGSVGGSRRSGGSPSREQGGLAATLTVQPGQSQNGFDPGAPSALGQVLEQRTPPPPIVVPDAPNSAQRYLSAAGQAPVLSAPAPQQSTLADLLAGIGASAGLPSFPDVDSGPRVGVEVTRTDSPRESGSGRRRGGLVGSVQEIDALAGRFGAPITARQEPGHASGGDHDPAVKGATARDIGGSEARRRSIFNTLTRRLGVKNATYKGADINVTRNGIRYQIISRDHGTGPHLHVGLRRV